MVDTINAKARVELKWQVDAPEFVSVLGIKSLDVGGGTKSAGVGAGGDVQTCTAKCGFSGAALGLGNCVQANCTGLCGF